ncbi:4-hydroxy-3-methylbut-2-enyl diphosphate reductase [bacterium]|nr:4-hydroxy-3-methylbut-2-enyl diphosphate reductase [bacterium]
MKKIKIAKSAGFCWGVRRAMEKVLDVAHKNQRVYTYGPLIHNPQAVRTLEKKGIKVINKIDSKIDGTVIIRTHGLSPKEREKLRQSGAKICDATCPDVAQIQGVVRKYLKKGYFIIIIGNPNHPEVKALLGYAENRGIAIMNPEDIEKLSLKVDEKICIISQSTQKREHFQELVEMVRAKYPNCEVFDTICESTAERQKETMALAREVDVMVVVGGKNSANTARLAQVSKEIGTKTFHIEEASEIKDSDFKEIDAIGVTAGASTPDWVIEEVVKRLEKLE